LSLLVVKAIGNMLEDFILGDLCPLTPALSPATGERAGVRGFSKEISASFRSMQGLGSDPAAGFEKLSPNEIKLLISGALNS
jgi:hypothetical protein